jgi:hypothetical protein
MPLFFLASLVLASISCAAAFSATYVGGFACRGGLTAGPGFLALDGDALIISRFTGDPLESDDVASVQAFTALLAAGRVPNATCGTVARVTWPNDVEPATATLGARGAVSALLAPGGFLVPPKTIGAVTLLNSTRGAPASSAFVLSAPKVLPGDGWFYHRAFFFDVDKDGRDDVIAARAVKPLVGASTGELVWFMQPAVDDPLAASALPWADAALATGAWSPDVLFAEPASLRGDADEQLLFTSFFTGGGLGLLQCAGCSASGANAWATADLERVVLDASIGPAFDVAVVDMNGDGRLDVLVTNHADNATAVNGVVYTSVVAIFEAPLAPTPLTNASAWTKHVVLNGMAVREPGPNQAAPGAARAFAPPGGAASSRPWISVSGDGDQRAYVLVPNAADPSDWTYTQHEVHDCAGTVGRQLSVVVDAVSYLVIPCYDSGKIEVYSLQE